MKEIQHFYLGPKDPKFETWRLTINDITKSVDYRLYFTNPIDNSKVLSKNIPAKASTSQMWHGIIDYFVGKFNSWSGIGI